MNGGPVGGSALAGVPGVGAGDAGGEGDVAPPLEMGEAELAATNPSLGVPAGLMMGAIVDPDGGVVDVGEGDGRDGG